MSSTGQALEQRVLPAVTLKFDYSLDTTNFFADANRKAVLELAGNLIAANLNDTLTAIQPTAGNSWNANIINPTTGRSQNLGNTTVPANTIRIFVGARDLSGTQLGSAVTGGYSATGNATWLNTIKGRGEAGALSATQTDTAPWGGSIAFDTKNGTAARSWFFGKTTNGLGSTQYDFLSVAIHEIGHLLGIHGGNRAMSRLVSGGKFNGTNAKAQNGAQGVPVLGSGDHIQEGFKNEGMEVSMDPSISAGTRKLFSDLEFAILKDIGWEVTATDDSIYQADHWLTHVVGVSPAAGSRLTRNAQTLENTKDVDILKVFASAGTRLTATVTPAGNLDTLVRIFDSSGLKVKQGPTAAGQPDVVTLDVTRSDYYFIAVSSIGNSTYNPLVPNSGLVGQTGTYNLRIDMANKPAVIAAANSLTQSAPNSATGMQQAAMLAETALLPPSIVPAQSRLPGLSLS